MLGLNLNQFLSFLRTAAKVIGGGLVTEGFMTATSEHEVLGFVLVGLGWLASHYAHAPVPPDGLSST